MLLKSGIKLHEQYLHNIGNLNLHKDYVTSCLKVFCLLLHIKSLILMVLTATRQDTKFMFSSSIANF